MEGCADGALRAVEIKQVEAVFAQVARFNGVKGKADPQVVEQPRGVERKCVGERGGDLRLAALPVGGVGARFLVDRLLLRGVDAAQLPRDGLQPRGAGKRTGGFELRIEAIERRGPEGEASSS